MVPLLHFIKHREPRLKTAKLAPKVTTMGTFNKFGIRSSILASITKAESNYLLKPKAKADIINSGYHLMLPTHNAIQDNELSGKERLRDKVLDLIMHINL